MNGDDDCSDLLLDSAGTSPSCDAWVEQYLDHHCGEQVAQRPRQKRVSKKQVWDAWNVALSTVHRMVGQFREGHRGTDNGLEYDAGAIDMAERIQEEIKTLYVNEDEEDTRERRKKK